MTDITPRRVDYAVGGDLSWLGSAHGLNATRSITLDMSKFTEGTHYPDGYVPSGTVVAKDDATGKYGPADAENTDDVVFTVGDRAVTAADASILVAGFDHGRIVETNLPVAVASEVKDAIGDRIQFV